MNQPYYFIGCTTESGAKMSFDPGRLVAFYELPDGKTAHTILYINWGGDKIQEVQIQETYDQVVEAMS